MKDLGVSVGNVLRRANLPGKLLSAGPASLTPAQAGDFWDAVAAEADDPQLPVRIGQAISVESFSPPILAAICSQNLNVAAARISVHKALIGPVRLVVTPEAAGTQIEIRWPDDHHVPELLATTEIVFWVALARLATRSKIVPVAATSTSPPQAPEAVAEYLGATIRQGDTVTVTFSAHDAAMPFLTADEPMWDVFAPELRRRLSELDATARTSERVRSALLELLPTGLSSVDAVSRELVVSPRTLQRQLRQDGTSFQSVLNQTRESLAQHYLGQGQLSTTDIAFLIGYDEPTSFARAFRSWTGQTPNTARAAAAAPAG